MMNLVYEMVPSLNLQSVFQSAIYNNNIIAVEWLLRDIGYAPSREDISFAEQHRTNDTIKQLIRSYLQ